MMRILLISAVLIAWLAGLYFFVQHDRQPAAAPKPIPSRLVPKCEPERGWHVRAILVETPDALEVRCHYWRTE